MADSAEAFLAGIENEVRQKERHQSNGSNTSNGYRERTGERPRDRDGDSRERYRQDHRAGRDGQTERDSYSHERRRREDDRDGYDRYPRRTYGDDRDRREDDRPRRRDDYYGGARDGRYSGSSSNRPRNDHGGGYPPRRERSRYDHEDDRRRRGGDWRSQDAREGSPSSRRSPTPEGTIPISERRHPSSKWDIPAPGFEGTSALAAKATGLFGIPGQTRLVGMPPVNLGVNAPGVPPGVGLPLPPIHMGGQASQHHSASSFQQHPLQDQAAGNAHRQARRLYVGNITYEASEQALVQFFNKQMLHLKLGTEPGEPAVSAQVNPDKGYAFVEFRHPEEATNAMSFDGIVFQNQSLKLRRPKDYIGPDVRPSSSIHVPGVISTNVPDSINKIFVGGLPTYLTDEQVIDLLQAFGELRAFNLVKESGTGASKGFAFCEYVDVGLTDLACQGLNGMQIEDRSLVVQRASVGSDKKALTITATGPSSSGLELTNSMQKFAGNGGDAGEPTSCMVMLNMVTPEELQNDEEYADIVEDIREECTKYGAVTDVRIPRPAKESKGAAAHSWKRTQGGEEQREQQKGEREGVGRVYVRYEAVNECSQALKAIAGRQFGGRMVICAFLKEDDWPADEDGGQNADATATQAAGPAFGSAD